ncbi:MAG: isoprenylcysteine carboxylmethyltransferase family protein [Gammaproteobacteria bacterium]|nr:MAG: isoprenylcysteine carboxylmethyltransferase family protein [Gammaproteobacteria bacterium]
MTPRADFSDPARPTLWRAIFAFLALPGRVAFAAPLWLARHGRTVAPWAPPRKLVTSGPYRLSRNPMYIGVIDVLLGYALAVAIAFHLRVLVSEEPWARRTFGADWEDYRARVPRWLPRLRKS